MKTAELLIRCLENEAIERIYGIPGEENIDVMDALLDSRIAFITTRHEQGAAFMADVHGRLTGRAGVCLSTLGPGATNLMTGVADANLDRAPLVAIAGQGATIRLHKESHQILDLVNLFEPVTKYSSHVGEPEIVPEIVRKAFKIAQIEKPGSSFISLPENIAAANVENIAPLHVQSPSPPTPPAGKVAQAAEAISRARFPIIMAGNGVIRAHASEALVRFAEALNIPVATTFMAKGVIPFEHELCLGAIGLQADDYISCGFHQADLVICIGYDLVEYPPHLWHRAAEQPILHIDQQPAEVDAHYIVHAGVLGDISASLDAIRGQATPRETRPAASLRSLVHNEIVSGAGDSGFPVKPQKILWDLRQALAPEDIVISDVGAHKIWTARLYQAQRPNTCLISNGFAAMGIAVPGAIAAKYAYPDRKVVAVTGDAGFLMNSQEIETAIRCRKPFVVLIWNDSQYGVIAWHQLRRFSRTSHVDFNNPDFVTYAKSFGANAYRIESADELLPALKQAVTDDRVSIIDCPVDYRENMKLTERLGDLVCPI